MLGDPVKALLFGELAESPQRRLRMPAGLVIPHAAVAVADISKYHKMVRVGGFHHFSCKMAVCISR